MDTNIFEDEEKIGISLDQIKNLCDKTKNKDPAEKPPETENIKERQDSTDEPTETNSDTDPLNDIDVDINLIHLHQNVITLMDYIEGLCNEESDMLIKDLAIALSDVLFLGLKTGLIEECENFSGDQWLEPLTNYSLDIDNCRENMPGVEEHLESCLCCQLLEALIQVRIVRNTTWSWNVGEVYWQLIVLQEELLANESEELNKLFAN